MPQPLQDLAVDADIAELVDDEREPLALGVLEQMADQRRLAGAEEAGDDGAGNAGERSGHEMSLSGSRGGMRATRPRLRESGRPRQGISPSVELAKSFAPAIRSGPLSVERSPKT